MKVLLVSHRYPPDGLVGVERVTQTHAAELVKAGHTVSVVTRRPGPDPEQPRVLRERQQNGVTIHRLIGGRNAWNLFPPQSERLERLFANVVLETAPDVVHFLHLLDHSPRLMDIAHRLDAAVVLALHDFYCACPQIILKQTSGNVCAGPDGGRECGRTCFAHEGADAAPRWGMRAAYFRRLLGVADRLMTPSAYVTSFFEKFGAPAARLRTIPNGINIDPAEVPPQPDPDPNGAVLNLAFLGSVVAHKGVHLIVEALRLARLSPVNLNLFGPVANPEYRSELEQRAATIPGLSLRVHGSYATNELSALLAGIDCVVMPSQWPETFALVAREAMVRGVPVLASRLGALQDAIVEGENGFTFAHDNPAELAGQLVRLVREPGLLQRLRDTARKTHVVTLSEHTEAVVAIYGEAIAEFQNARNTSCADTEELNFLHTSLADFGFLPAN
ncbi:MAG: hypothetical protein QOE70_6475 [Chthoniobacter sp.]|jgi:glycosyltransferase involved in cell wall biosynthesis|nr:hypothetical protein [Chthoniobacter sp.]